MFLCRSSVPDSQRAFNMFIKMPAYFIFPLFLFLYAVLFNVSEWKKPKFDLSGAENRALWNPISSKWRAYLIADRGLLILAERSRRMLHLLAISMMGLLFFLSYQIFECTIKIEILSHGDVVSPQPRSAKAPDPSR